MRLFICKSANLQISDFVECALQPVQPGRLNQNNIETAGRQWANAQQEMPGCTNHAPLLDSTDAGRSAPMRRTGTRTHFYKDQRTIGGTHNQIDFAATTARRPIIALHQAQALPQQIPQGAAFSRIANLFCGDGT